MSEPPKTLRMLQVANQPGPFYCFLRPLVFELMRRGVDVDVACNSGDARCDELGRAGMKTLPLTVGPWRHPGTWLTLRRQLAERMSHLWRGVRVLLGRRESPESATVNQEDAVARLKAIGLRPECRGSGTARKLLESFEHQMAARGVQRLGLSVLHGNDRAIAFYRKTGWREIQNTDRGIWFVKEIGASSDSAAAESV